MSVALAFVVLFLLGFIGQAIVQDAFNKVEPVAVNAPVGGQVPGPAVMPTTSQPTAPQAFAPVPPTISPQASVAPDPTQQPPAAPPVGPVVG
jgi:hypothetical protein